GNEFAMILLWGLERDRPLAAVRNELLNMGAKVFFLDQLRILNTAIEIQVDRDVDGQITVDTDIANLRDISSVYVRPYDFRRLPPIARAAESSPEWAHAS